MKGDIDMKFKEIFKDFFHSEGQFIARKIYVFSWGNFPMRFNFSIEETPLVSIEMKTYQFKIIFFGMFDCTVFRICGREMSNIYTNRNSRGLYGFHDFHNNIFYENDDLIKQMAMNVILFRRINFFTCLLFTEKNAQRQMQRVYEKIFATEGL